MPYDDASARARSRISSKAEIDPAIRALNDAWDSLPGTIRAGIAAMVQAALKQRM